MDFIFIFFFSFINPAVNPAEIPHPVWEIWCLVLLNQTQTLQVGVIVPQHFETYCLYALTQLILFFRKTETESGEYRSCFIKICSATERYLVDMVLSKLWTISQQNKMDKISETFLEHCCKRQ